MMQKFSLPPGLEPWSLKPKSHVLPTSYPNLDPGCLPQTQEHLQESFEILDAK